MAFVHSAIVIPYLSILAQGYTNGVVKNARMDASNSHVPIDRNMGQETTMPRDERRIKSSEKTTTFQRGNISGDKQTFSSGATSSKHLPMYDLIPLEFLRRTAERFTLGAEKHGKFNYRKGLKDKEFILDRLNHAFLHLKLAIDMIENGEVYQDDDLGGVAVNVAMAMEYQQTNGLTPKS